jgi:hypothetical protein
MLAEACGAAGWPFGPLLAALAALLYRSCLRASSSRRFCVRLAALLGSLLAVIACAVIAGLCGVPLCAAALSRDVGASEGGGASCCIVMASFLRKGSSMPWHDTAMTGAYTDTTEYTTTNRAGIGRGRRPIQSGAIGSRIGLESRQSPCLVRLACLAPPACGITQGSRST